MAGMPDKFPARRDRWRHRSWHTRGTRSHRESNGGGQCTAPRRGGNREHLQPNRDSISDRTRPGPRTKPDDIRRAGGQFLGVGLLRTWIVLQRIASGCRWRDPLSIRLVLRHLPADDITDQLGAPTPYSRADSSKSPTTMGTETRTFVPTPLRCSRIPPAGPPSAGMGTCTQSRTPTSPPSCGLSSSVGG